MVHSRKIIHDIEEQNQLRTISQHVASHMTTDTHTHTTLARARCQLTTATLDLKPTATVHIHLLLLEYTVLLKLLFPRCFQLSPHDCSVHIKHIKVAFYINALHNPTTFFGPSAHILKYPNTIDSSPTITAHILLKDHI
jgi:hypothetical protein